MQTTSKIMKLCDGLIQLLKAERDMLGQGHYERLEEITEMKTAYSEALSKSLTEQIAKTTPHHLQQKLQRVNKLAQDNARIFTAAIKGAEHALLRLATIRNREVTVGAYGAQGEQLMISGNGYARSKRV